MDRCTRTKSLFRDLIGVRYTHIGGLPAHPSASSEEETIDGMRMAPNPIGTGGISLEIVLLPINSPVMSLAFPC